MKRFLILGALLALAGCDGMGQRVPNPYYVPLPTGEQLRAQQPQPYMMPIPQQQAPQQIRQPLRCSTRYVGNTAYTDCY